MHLHSQRVAAVEEVLEEVVVAGWAVSEEEREGIGTFCHNLCNRCQVRSCCTLSYLHRHRRPHPGQKLDCQRINRCNSWEEGLVGVREVAVTAEAKAAEEKGEAVKAVAVKVAVATEEVMVVGWEVEEMVAVVQAEETVAAMEAGAMVVATGWEAQEGVMVDRLLFHPHSNVRKRYCSHGYRSSCGFDPLEPQHVCPCHDRMTPRPRRIRHPGRSPCSS